MQFERGLGGLAGAAAVPAAGPAATVPAAAFDQQTSREEGGARHPQLLAQVDGVVPWRAAVALHVVVETVQVN